MYLIVIDHPERKLEPCPLTPGGSAMKKLTIVGLLVRDYDEAIQFYTGKLGFVVGEDIASGGDRWVVLSLPDSREPGLALELARTEADLTLVGHQAGSFPLFAL